MTPATAPGIVGAWITPHDTPGLLNAFDPMRTLKRVRQPME
jgi:hypothetical protein